MAHDVFVSYSSKDKPTADAVCAVLESHGIRCWVAPRDIIPGRDWGGSIIQAIAGAKVMVLVFSANANASTQIKREVERAVNKGIPVIPLRIEDVAPTETLEYFLSTPHWLDAFTPPLERHLEYLADVVHKIVGGPEASSALPERVIAGIPRKVRKRTRLAAYARSFKRNFLLSAAILLAIAGSVTWLLMGHRHEQELDAPIQLVDTKSPKPAKAEPSVGPTASAATPVIESSHKLVAWWPAEGNTDDVIGGNNGTLQNGATFGPGKVGRAFRFDGVDDYVVIPTLVNNWVEGTIAAWVNYVNAFPGRHGSFIFAATQGDPVTGHWDVTNLGIHPDLGSGTDLGFGIFAGGWQWAASGITPTSGRWYHVAGTWGSQGIKIYIDGVLRRSYPYIGPTARAFFNIIGASSWPGSSVNGLVDELSIYSRALSDAEIQSIYNAGAAGKR